MFEKIIGCEFEIIKNCPKCKTKETVIIRPLFIERFLLKGNYPYIETTCRACGHVWERKAIN